MKFPVNTFVAVIAGVLVAGLVMKYAKQIPGVKQAQDGFQGVL